MTWKNERFFSSLAQKFEKKMEFELTKCQVKGVADQDSELVMFEPKLMINNNDGDDDNGLSVHVTLNSVRIEKGETSISFALFLFANGSPFAFYASGDADRQQRQQRHAMHDYLMEAELGQLNDDLASTRLEFVLHILQEQENEEKVSDSSDSYSRFDSLFMQAIPNVAQTQRRGRGCEQDDKDDDGDRMLNVLSSKAKRRNSRSKSRSKSRGRSSRSRRRAVSTFSIADVFDDSDDNDNDNDDDDDAIVHTRSHVSGSLMMREAKHRLRVHDATGDVRVRVSLTLSLAFDATRLTCMEIEAQKRALDDADADNLDRWLDDGGNENGKLLTMCTQCGDPVAPRPSGLRSGCRRCGLAVCRACADACLTRNADFGGLRVCMLCAEQIKHEKKLLGGAQWLCPRKEERQKHVPVLSFRDVQLSDEEVVAGVASSSSSSSAAANDDVDDSDGRRQLVDATWRAELLVDFKAQEWGRLLNHRTRVVMVHPDDEQRIIPLARCSNVSNAVQLARLCQTAVRHFESRHAAYDAVLHSNFDFSEPQLSSSYGSVSVSEAQRAGVALYNRALGDDDAADDEAPPLDDLELRQLAPFIDNIFGNAEFAKLKERGDDTLRAAQTFAYKTRSADRLYREAERAIRNFQTFKASGYAPLAAAAAEERDRSDSLRDSLRDSNGGANVDDGGGSGESLSSLAAMAMAAATAANNRAMLRRRTPIKKRDRTSRVALRMLESTVRLLPMLRKLSAAFESGGRRHMMPERLTEFVDLVERLDQWYRELLDEMIRRSTLCSGDFAGFDFKNQKYVKGSQTSAPLRSAYTAWLGEQVTHTAIVLRRRRNCNDNDDYDDDDDGAPSQDSLLLSHMWGSPVSAHNIDNFTIGTFGNAFFKPNVECIVRDDAMRERIGRVYANEHDCWQDAVRVELAAALECWHQDNAELLLRLRNAVAPRLVLALGFLNATSLRSRGWRQRCQFQRHLLTSERQAACSTFTINAWLQSLDLCGLRLAGRLNEHAVGSGEPSVPVDGTSIIPNDGIGGRRRIQRYSPAYFIHRSASVGFIDTLPPHPLFALLFR
jgi:hypothetical protein